MTEFPAKPLPAISDFNRPFWSAARRHKLSLQKCKSCEKIWAPNGPVCPHCFSDDYEWVELSGRGKIASWVVFHKVYYPSFAEDVPYGVAFVELEEGPRIISSIVDTPGDQIRIGMPVSVVFEDVNEDVSLPKFKAA